MRRPSKTKAQRDYERSQRALLRLRRAAVKWSEGSMEEGNSINDGVALINALTDLQAAADGYTMSLGTRERKQLAK